MMTQEPTKYLKMWTGQFAHAGHIDHECRKGGISPLAIGITTRNKDDSPESARRRQPLVHAHRPKPDIRLI